MDPIGSVASTIMFYINRKEYFLYFNALFIHNKTAGDSIYTLLKYLMCRTRARARKTIKQQNTEFMEIGFWGHRGRGGGYSGI